ncbi:MAG: bifunctional phosphoribosylaminoimidazolecarboxamide formyltransferase/IMP cyclohydrolase [Candidatus Peregrinibacteria bacterium]
MPISRALISVSDKTGLLPLARFLAERGVEILSTGGTAKTLRENNIPVLDVSEYTGFPEMLDGRVKTLHPKIHGGLLYVRGNAEHEKTVAEHDIGAIDLVIVNLYPFAEVLKKGGTKEELIENIDIGGPSMLRSAAKNFKSVTVVTDPADYPLLIQELSENNGETTLETRAMLMGKVYATTAAYDALIASSFSHFFAIGGTEVFPLRYGENPHQKAAFYTLGNTEDISLPNAHQIQGKDLSYNNILDADSALRAVLEFSEDPACIIVKHLSPCGVAQGKTLLEAYEKSLASDLVSAFGGVIACNREVTGAVAEKMSELFLEIIIAPAFSLEAREIFQKTPNLRVLTLSPFVKSQKQKDVRAVLGGFLVQDADTAEVAEEGITIATTRAPTPEEMGNLLFAWKCVKSVKSNAIVIAKNGATVGIGGGLTSRVDASELAVKKAGEKALGAVAASDAFFPFADGPEALGKAGITAIIQPGGSKRDAEVIEKCNELGIAMVFTGIRAFRH